MAGFSDQPPGTAVQPCPVQQTGPTYWIEIELLGEDGSPIPWEQYEVELPNGVPALGFLDGDGFARLENLDTEGVCQVRFPNLDKDAWSKVETRPARAAGGTGKD